MGMGAGTAAAEQGFALQSEEWVTFNIPAQPLAAALDAYGATTGLAVLYDGQLAFGRRSVAVKGQFTPQTALRLLLTGSGLAVVYAGTNAFAVIQPPPTAASLRAKDVRPATGRHPYFADIQAGIEEAFCRAVETRPGRYRVVLRFWIGPSGEILRPALLGSTGDLRLDRSITDRLTHAMINRPPPANMRQPITMVVSPRPPEETGDCGPIGAADIKP